MLKPKGFWQKLVKIGENLRYQVFKKRVFIGRITYFQLANNILIETSSFDAKILNNQRGYYKKLALNSNIWDFTY